MIFQNIDGNRTNFDAFSLDIERIAFRFQIIGLAETNIGADESPVYKLEGYNAYYQEKHVNKAKGTGVALYVEDSLNAVVNDDLSWVTKNLETLFVTIQHDEPLHVCIVYRPPGGDSTEALLELEKIIELCPKKSVNFLGDFNINLHDLKSKLVSNFETVISGLGLVPVISTYTHEKPGCKESCIDNILTNDIENTVCSGTIDTSVSHHKAVFHIINSSLCSNAGPKQKYIQYYDYCASNVAKFTEALSNELNAQQPEEFDKFHTVFIKQLDQACKLEQPKCSKRTAKNNPWITSGLIASVNKTHELKDIWIKAKKEKCLNIEDQKQFNCNCNNCTLTNKRQIY